MRPHSWRRLAEKRSKTPTSAWHHGRSGSTSRKRAHLGVEHLGPLDLRENRSHPSRERRPTQGRVSDVEEGVRREALGEGRGETVLDWGSYMNRSRAMDLLVEDVTHWLFGRGSNGHSPHGRAPDDW